MGTKTTTTRKVILSFDEDDNGINITIDHEGFNGEPNAVPLYIHAALESIIAGAEEYQRPAENSS